MLKSQHLLTNGLGLLFLLAAATFANTAWADPSGRVAHLTDAQGYISYSPAGEDRWVDIVRNRPLISGDRLWSDRASRVEFQVGSSAIRLGSNTSVELLDLDDDIAQLQLTEGSVNVRVRRLYRGQTIEVDTPMLAFSINRKGSYRIDVDPEDGLTTVTVWQGAGTAYGEHASFRVRAGDAVAFYDVGLRDYEIYGPGDEDDFDLYALDRDRRLDRSESLRYLDDDVVGYAELDQYGSWGADQSYGHVWYPRGVGADWAPYRDGHWVWQEPWGWTWVDNAPWGFAPSHYGRWVSVHDRWGWVPGPRRVRPIYAPALVAFVGGSGWNLSLSLGGGASAVGWFPLGPREVYVPSYHASREYFNRVNVNNTSINNTTINNVYNNYSSGDINVHQANYANRNVASAVTAVPRNVFVNAQPVRQGALRIDRKTLRNIEVTRVAPIAPSEHSLIGAGKDARSRPGRKASERRVVAHNVPPPAEVPFARREKLLQQQPGRALEPAAVEAVRSKQNRHARIVRVSGEQQQPVDIRTMQAERKIKAGKLERLDRSSIARHEPGRVRSADKIDAGPAQGSHQDKAPNDERGVTQKQAPQRQHEADSGRQRTEKQQRKAGDHQPPEHQRDKQHDKLAAADKSPIRPPPAHEDNAVISQIVGYWQDQTHGKSTDNRSAVKHERQGEDKASANRPEGRFSHPNDKAQQARSKAQDECQHEARRHSLDEGLCQQSP